MSGGNGYTPTERRMLAVLGDGLSHTAEELRRCLDDDLAGPTAVPAHVSTIRAKLESTGRSVIFRSGGYRMVRLLPLND